MLHVPTEPQLQHGLQKDNGLRAQQYRTRISNS
jgi:hypothetical protein